MNNQETYDILDRVMGLVHDALPGPINEATPEGNAKTHMLWAILDLCTLVRVLEGNPQTHLSYVTEKLERAKRALGAAKHHLEFGKDES
jgi:hypothetical protein